MRWLLPTVAATALGALGLAESLMIFAWPIWAALLVTFGSVWAGLTAFEQVPRAGKPLRPRRRSARKPKSRKADGDG